MTDDFNYEAPHIDEQAARAARVDAELYGATETLEDHAFTLGSGTTVTVRLCVRQTRGLSESDWSCWTAQTVGDEFPPPLHHFYHATRYSRDMGRDDHLVGTREDAIQDVLTEIALDLTDPAPLHTLHLDRELIDEINRSGEELAQRGLRQVMIAVDVGGDKLVPVVVRERAPYHHRHANGIDEEAVEAELFEITAPGHRYRHCEPIAKGRGQNPHCAILRVIAKYHEYVRRNRPAGIDAMEAGPELDLACAQARKRWRYGHREAYYVESFLLPDSSSLCSDELHPSLTSAEFYQLQLPDGYQQVCVVRQHWYSQPLVFRPSTDWNDAMELFDDLAASDIGGSAVLDLDGDCFEPPPWRVRFSGGGLGAGSGGVAVGPTGQVAICRTHLQNEAAGGPLPRWDLMDGHHYDPFGDHARERAESVEPIADMRHGDPNGDPNGDMT